MQEALVSIIIPSYNTEKNILKESILSIVNQTYHNLQIIIIDDGSIYPVKNVINDITDDRILVLRNETNRGLVYSLNRGIKQADGKYIARMDADDIAHPDRIICQVNYLDENSDIDIVSSFARSFGAKEIVYKSVTDDAGLKAELLWKNPFVHPTVMMRTEIIKSRKIYYSPEDKSEDFGLWSRLAFEENLRFAVIPKELLDYRIHGGQITQKKSDILQKDEERIIRNSFNLLKISLTENELKSYFKFRNLKKLIGYEKIEVLIAIAKIHKQLPKNISKKHYRTRIYKELFKRIKGQ